MQPEIAPIPPASVIGKKQVALDDLRIHVNIPAQANGKAIENNTSRKEVLKKRTVVGNELKLQWPKYMRPKVEINVSKKSWFQAESWNCG